MSNKEIKEHQLFINYVSVCYVCQTTMTHGWLLDYFGMKDNINVVD